MRESIGIRLRQPNAGFATTADRTDRLAQEDIAVAHPQIVLRSSRARRIADSAAVEATTPRRGRRAPVGRSISPRNRVQPSPAGVSHVPARQWSVGRGCATGTRGHVQGELRGVLRRSIAVQAVSSLADLSRRALLIFQADPVAPQVAARVFVLVLLLGGASFLGERTGGRQRPARLPQGVNRPHRAGSRRPDRVRSRATGSACCSLSGCAYAHTAAKSAAALRALPERRPVIATWQELRQSCRRQTSASPCPSSTPIGETTELRQRRRSGPDAGHRLRRRHAGRARRWAAAALHAVCARACR